MNRFAPWRILHLDLARGVCPLSSIAPYRRLIVVFWWRNVALGRREYDPGELPRPAAVVAEDAAQAIAPAVIAHLFQNGAESPVPRCDVLSAGAGVKPPSLDAALALRDPLSALDQRLAGTGSIGTPPGDLSVIVCTRNRPASLARCLRALTAARGDIAEIIVVDNAPESGAARLVVERFQGVRYLAEPSPGLSVARNAGVRGCSGDLVAFTDDDVEAHSDWAKRMKRAFIRPEVVAVTGLVLPAALDTDAQIAFEKGFGGFSGGFCPLEFDRAFFEATKARGVPVWRLGAGANMAFRRTVFDRVGLFDERLGAGAAGCSEDSEFWYRLLAAGLVCRYDPMAVVFHHHREEWAELRRQLYCYMRGHVTALIIQFRRHGDWGNMRRLMAALPLHYLALTIRHLLLGRQYWSLDLLWPEIRGCLAGLRSPARQASRRRNAA